MKIEDRIIIAEIKEKEEAKEQKKDAVSRLIRYYQTKTDDYSANLTNLIIDSFQEAYDEYGWGFTGTSNHP